MKNISRIDAAIVFSIVLLTVGIIYGVGKDLLLYSSDNLIYKLLVTLGIAVIATLLYIVTSKFKDYLQIADLSVRNIVLSLKVFLTRKEEERRTRLSQMRRAANMDKMQKIVLNTHDEQDLCDMQALIELRIKTLDELGNKP